MINKTAIAQAPSTSATMSSASIVPAFEDEMSYPMSQLEPVTDVVVLPAIDSGDDTATPEATVATTETNAVVVPVTFYSRTALALLQLKCPAIRDYISGSSTAPTTAALRIGFNQTLARFDDGPDVVSQANEAMPGFDRIQFDVDIESGRQATTPCYTCAQARVDGSSMCPTRGCVLPDATLAEHPTDLLVWDCNVKNVGHATLASSIMTSEFSTSLIGVRDTVRAYREGVYEEVEDDELRNNILAHLGPMGTNAQISEIDKILRIAHVQHNDMMTPNPNFIAFKNGTLNVASRTLEAHSPAHMLQNRIDHAYQADATCPRFLGFLDSIWEPDADRPQKIAFIRQWLGYLMVADNSLQVMLILKGEGANGKSVLIDVIEGMIGSVNCEAAMLDRFGMPYVRATLVGKLVNLSADLPKKTNICDGYVKAIVAGDRVEVSPKHKPSYKIKPYVRLMVATNNMPRSNDTTEGFFRRLIVLTFNRMFAVAERDPHLSKTLLGEIPGIIAWAVDGLYDLRANDRFNNPTSSDQAMAVYREELSPERLFAAECLDHSTDRSGYIPRDLYMAFRAWCRHRGFDAGSMVTFGRELGSMGFQQQKSGKTWWRIVAKQDGAEYFRAAQIVPSPASSRIFPELPIAA
ncbi:DNA primase family protein [Massilia glaciei]|uniref:SF3 helicase domain-containing protein n=1 Tax=Massilia glaciei TaxID=1524097 RepID=A0A2U2HGF9_9BURK|nr:phage/plasmid primase, P4 family [Massilia glaciei]PWF44020.1 hypothetical protein C7C56_019990 [Massilia glaciei]